MHLSLKIRSNLSWASMMISMAVNWWFFYLPVLQVLNHHAGLIKTAVAIYAIVVIAILSYLNVIVLAKGGLVTTGVYRLVAHPVYYVYIIADFMCLLLLPNQPILSYISSTWLISSAILAAYYEELKLIEWYGQAAVEYLDRSVSVRSAAKVLSS